MRLHVTLTGHEIRYDDPTPEVEAFLTRAKALSEDPSASPNDLIALVYGPENPIMDRTLLPGRGAVTKEVLRNPVYRVLGDLIYRAEVRASGESPEVHAALYTFTAAEVAAQVGVHVSAVHKAVSAGRVGSWIKNGQHYFRPETVASWLKAREQGRHEPGDLL